MHEKLHPGESSGHPNVEMLRLAVTKAREAAMENLEAYNLI